MTTLARDLRYALRMMRRSPGFTSVAILILALAIGANTAIFTLVDAAVLRLLPVRDPGQLVLLTNPDDGGMSNGTSDGRRDLLTYQEYLALHDNNRVFSGLMAAESGDSRAAVAWDGGEPERVSTRMVSGNYFSVLGVPAFRGRLFTDAEDEPLNAHAEAVISFAYWQLRFGGRLDALGRTAHINGHPFTVIGVAAPGFDGESVGSATALWVPLSMQATLDPGFDWLHDPPGVTRTMWLWSMGRLKPGVTLAQAQTDVNGIFHRSIEAQADQAANPVARKALLTQYLQLTGGGKGASSIGNLKAALFALFGLVGLILLLAIVNLASMLLARASAREKEMGVRLALGAGRVRLVRQLLTESVLLALLGGGLGWLLALVAERALVRMVGTGGADIVLNLTPDWRVLAFTLGACLAAGALFGLAPAMRMSSLDINRELQSQGRGSTAAQRRILTHFAGGRFAQRGWPLGKLMVVGQVALSVALLVGSGLFVRSLRKLTAVPLGYETQHLAIVPIGVKNAGYAGPQVYDVLERLRLAMAAVPGVAAVTYSDDGLFSHSESGTEIGIQGYRDPKGGEASSRFDTIGPNYFSAIGIPMLLGREIGPQDNAAGVRVGVVNQSFARKFFAGVNPIGRRITDLYPDDKGASLIVVGVARDAKYNNLRETEQPRFYVPAGEAFPTAPPSGANFEIRTFGSPGAVAAGVRAAVRTVDPKLIVPEFQPMTVLVDNSLVSERILARLSAVFGLLAPLLAAIGLYGVMSYTVARRTHEIGIRMALGAVGGDVVAMILGESVLLAVAGLALGLPASALGGRWVASQLFGVQPADPYSFSIAAAVLLATALAAGFLPARRAARVDPMQALRVE